MQSFTPATNAKGDSFTFQMLDDGGVDRDPIAKTLTLNVTSVNNAPLGTSTTVTTLEDMPCIFTWSDFRVSYVD